MGIERLSDLVPDIYKLFNPEKQHTVSEENLNVFAEECKNLLRQRLAKPEVEQSRPIRFSSLGKPDRQVWMDAHPDLGKEEKLTPKTYVKFLYGDLIEQLLLFLVREAGYSVEDAQRKVEIDGITGSIDCKIEGVVVDAKSASSYGFKKFETNTVPENDTFGYVAQLAGYGDVLTPGEDAAWLAIDKVNGDICVSVLPKEIIAEHKPETRIEQLKAVIEQPQPPEKCYKDIPDGKSGNRKLATGCGYCKHKIRCWPNLKVYQYSTGPKFFTYVAREPKVPRFEDA